MILQQSTSDTNHPIYKITMRNEVTQEVRRELRREAGTWKMYNVQW